MYFADRSNAGVEVIDTRTLTWKRLLPGFKGAVHNPNGTVNNNISGPDGVVSHGRWLYAGDGDSSLKVFDLDGASTAVASIPTGGSTRVDEMALTSNGKLLLAANNAEDPPFATLFAANGNAAKNSVSKIARIIVDQAIIPAGAGLSLEQPAWDPTTKRFFTSIPIIANNPTGCNYGQVSGPITCHGGVLVIDPKTVTGPTTQLSAFNPANLVESATCEAFKRARGAVPTTLELSDFISGFDYIYSHDDLMMGVNPFRVADLKSIPTIPLTRGEEEEDPEDTPKTKKPSRGSQAGSRIRA
ncbi:lactonase family protein [Bradyrhizobium cytisi]|uniref:Lactonase family protein n=1 Tax=Bradyrhizobium cytisi TaxID=515489 RepID=A0A5S4X1Z6_9BRAD|nr:lactonase family protein [Bradyrhizobium cytisi]TYL83568.1 lactonase family protein [Bradyrhizobium cytisi]